MKKPFNWQKESEREWDNRADSWNKRSMELWDKGNRKRIVPFIEKHIPEQSKVLDIGCGDGYGSYKLQQSGYEVVGMDFSSEMINRAKKSLHKSNINFLQGDIGDLPFDADVFDGVMAINVLEWTEVPAQAISELWRVIKKDGLLCVGVLGPTAGPRSNNYPRLHGEEAVINTMMPWEFQQLAREQGFKYIDGFGVYKKSVKEHHYQGLTLDLQQSLTFMWVFMLQKVGE